SVSLTGQLLKCYIKDRSLAVVELSGSVLLLHESAGCEISVQEGGRAEAEGSTEKRRCLIWAPSREAAWEEFQKTTEVLVVMVEEEEEEEEEDREEAELQSSLVVPLLLNTAEAVTRWQQIAAPTSDSQRFSSHGHYSSFPSAASS
ncbi:uncharacterized, partial [Tachysurus ichikawai]